MKEIIGRRKSGDRARTAVLDACPDPARLPAKLDQLAEMQIMYNQTQRCLEMHEGPMAICKR